MLKIVVVILLFLGIISEFTEKKGWYSITAVSFLFLLIALRNEVCFLDTPRYVDYYRSLTHISWDDIPFFFPKDPFFWYFSKLICVVSHCNYTIWFSIIGAIYCVALYRIIRYSHSPFLSVLLFFVLGFFVFSMTGLRQNMAFSFVMFSYPYLCEKKPIPFFLLIVLAALFHKTALIFIIIYPLRYIKFSSTLSLLYIGVAIFCLTMGDSIIDFISQFSIDDRLDEYYEDARTLNYSGLYIQCGIILISYIVIGKERNSDESSILFHLGAIAILFRSLTGVMAETFRLSMYFGIFYMILLPLSINALRVNKGLKNILELSIAAVFSLYIVFSSNSGFSDPYLFFWQPSLSLA